MTVEHITPACDKTRQQIKGETEEYRDIQRIKKFYPTQAANQ